MENITDNQKHIMILCKFMVPLLKEVSRQAVEKHLSVLDMMKVVSFVFFFLIYPPKEELEVYIAVLDHVIKEANKTYLDELKNEKEDGEKK